MFFVHRLFDENGNNIKSQDRYDEVDSDEGIVCTYDFQGDSCPWKEKCYKEERCPLFLYEEEWDKSVRELQRRNHERRAV